MINLMKKNYLLYAFVFIVQLSLAQVNFEHFPIMGGFIGTENVELIYSADIDGDGDLDILTTIVTNDNNVFSNKVIWYKNIDGLGTFGITPKVVVDIPNISSNGLTLYATDIDNDGDADVAYGVRTTGGDNVWYENLDGLGSFGEERVITTEVDLLRAVDFKDMDGDGDKDVLSASDGDGKVAWYENLDGIGTFGSQNIISTLFARSVYGVDLDGDGDLDVLAASNTDDKIVWHENTDGVGTFGSEKVVSENNAFHVYADDIDGDGDFDVLSVSLGNDNVIWYENTDGLGTFGTPTTITASAVNPGQVYSFDVDNDGDKDVLSTSWGEPIVWYENVDGLGTFGTEHIIAITNLRKAFFF